MPRCGTRWCGESHARWDLNLMELFPRAILQVEADARHANGVVAAVEDVD